MEDKEKIPKPYIEFIRASKNEPPIIVDEASQSPKVYCYSIEKRYFTATFGHDGNWRQENTIVTVDFWLKESQNNWCENLVSESVSTLIFMLKHARGEFLYRINDSEQIEVEIGSFLGIPDCCIKRFIEGPPFSDSQKKAARFRIIPCDFHAEQLNNNFIGYSKLLESRHSKIKGILNITFADAYCLMQRERERE